MMGRVVVALVVMAVAGSAVAMENPFGDWQGTWKSPDGNQTKLCAQVIDWGDGKFQANMLERFDTRNPKLCVLQGQRHGQTVAFSGKAAEGKLKGTEWSATVDLKAETFTGRFQGPTSGTFALKKVVRLSPTLGAKPPAGAIVLFDGTSLKEWVHRNGQPCHWKLVPEEKAMEVRGGGIISKRKFRDHKVHLEFRTPFKPKARGQGRGNSGVYLQGRYEVQVLDSYGLEGRSNECGGIYGVAAPRVNMCAPPLQWQTYDITFRAPRFNQKGKKIKNARMTVYHNGVLIHDNVEVPHGTTANWGGDPKEPGGLHLQDHGNPVQYRNIWVVELKDEN